MERYDIINSLIERKGYKSYLEIGVRNPWECFDKINCEVKHSVDPGYETGGSENLATYHYTSDGFFSALHSGQLNIPHDFKWDIIFIDGLHISDQVYLDFLNSTLHLSVEGVVVFHDCNPPLCYYAREDYHDISTPAGGYWNGTVWKAIQKIRTTPLGLDGQAFDLLTVDSDWGVGIAWRGKAVTLISPDFNTFYEYNTFAANRKQILNLLSVQEFQQWLQKF